LLIYPCLSSSAPNAQNVFLSALLIGVPVSPNKNALGRAVLIFLPKSPSCVLCASSTNTIMLFLSFKTPSTSPNLNMVVIKIFRVSCLKKFIKSCLLSAPIIFGISDALNVDVICVSKSSLSTTTQTVGFLSAVCILSFCAANTISSDLPLP